MDIGTSGEVILEPKFKVLSSLKLKCSVKGMTSMELLSGVTLYESSEPTIDLSDSWTGQGGSDLVFGRLGQKEVVLKIELKGYVPYEKVIQLKRGEIVEHNVNLESEQ